MRRKRYAVLRRPTPERVSGFSDGVFAVLITVLVFNLHPPELPTFGALLLLWPTWLSYAVSYLFIAIVWTNHNYLMRYATEANPRLLWCEAVEKRVCRGRQADLNSPGCGGVSALIRALRPGLLAAAVRHR